MFPFRDNTLLSNFLLISIVEAKSFYSSCAISRFSLDCISKFVEDCSSSIFSARCELDELPDVSKILLKLAVSATSLGWVTLTKIKTHNVKLVEKCLKGITPSYFSKYFQIRRNNSHHHLKL